ncbi:protein unc-13 homolog C-like [Mytilus edulis]|uniref:protein unc-13 homolog C-like n=1 Tax=Mytilus edulis TaxID=6550 RepID=UPI0039EEB7DF
MANIETKLTTLDKIESRLNKMETKFGSMDNEIIDCKKRISTLEQSAQFLSNAHDDLKGLKLKVDTINSGVELTKNENKEVRDKLVDIESQNLKQNLVFFEIEEASENNEGAKGGATGSTYNENCVNKILEFCENQLKIENAKDKITLEKAYRLGKRKNGAAKPRSIVWKFRKFEDREMIRSVSNRLKNTNYGISPQYPKEVLERRKKLVPIMLKERKKNQKSLYCWRQIVC